MADTPIDSRVVRLVPRVAVFILLAALLVVRVSLAHSINVHWDEFYFLSKIHSYARGDLTGALLTFHVHLLGWVRAVADDEVTQVLRIREVMLALGVVASVATFFIGRWLLQSTMAAAFAVFAGQSLSLVLNHGSSARFDPFVVAALLVAGALIVRGGRRAVLLAGAVAAVGFLVSVKSSLYAPLYVGLFACRLVWADANTRREVLREALLFAFGFVVTCVPLFAWHSSTLAPNLAPAAAAGGANEGGGLNAILAKVIVPDIGVQNERALFSTLQWDWGFWMLLVAGVVLAAFLIWRDRSHAARLRHAQLLCFALPLASLFFYRNSFPYFYVCVAPPAALLVGLVVARIEQRLARHAMVAFVVLIVVAVPVVRAATNWTRYNGDNQLDAQRQIIAAVHETFPESVRYIDRCAMIASYEKVGPFMSTWTLSEYRAKQTPVMRDLLREQKPQFLLQNITSLELANKFKGSKSFHRLLRPDFDALRMSFIPHWGPLWVAGQTIDLAAPVDTPVPFEVLIPGAYVVEADGPVVVDTQTVEPRTVVNLALGDHHVTSAVPALSRVTFRIASARPPPKSTPPTASIFQGFQFRKGPMPDEAHEGDDD